MSLTKVPDEICSYLQIIRDFCSRQSFLPASLDSHSIVYSISPNISMPAATATLSDSACPLIGI